MKKITNHTTMTISYTKALNCFFLWERICDCIQPVIFERPTCCNVFFYIKLVRGKYYKGKLDLNHIDFRRKSSNVWQFYFVGLAVG